MLQTNKRSAFTLIELLVTISIIAIISAIGLATFSGSQKRARDGRRVSDLNQYQIALENYASANNGLYPTTDGDSTAGSSIFSTSASPIATFITGYPTDPKGGTYYYRAAAGGSGYVLAGCMEANSNQAYEICSNGKIGLIPATTTCNSALTSSCLVP